MMNNLPANLQDAALSMSDSVECLQVERKHNAMMIAIAVTEGIRAGKAKEDVRTNGDWSDAMCQLAYTVRCTVMAS
jgi:hypothetical protein